MDDRRREDPDALRRGARRVGRRRWLRHRGRLGRAARRGARRALRPGEVPRPDAPSPAASRSGWCWSSCSRGPDEVLLLDEPDNFLDVPGKMWLERRITRVGEDDPVHQPRPRAARQHRDPGGHRRARRRRQHRVDASGRLRVVPRGAAGPVRALRGAAPALGRGAREAQGAGAALQDQGGVQRRAGLAVQGRPDPAAQVRGGRSAARRSRASSRSRCGSRAAAPASARWSARASS